MLTVRFPRLGLTPGDLVLDAGAGFGRHAYEVARLGGRIVALDYADDEVRATRATFGAMIEQGQIESDNYVGALRGDATRLPFADGTFDRVITSEVLEHIQNDVAAISELARVLRPGGTLACTAGCAPDRAGCSRPGRDGSSQRCSTISTSVPSGARSVTERAPP